MTTDEYLAEIETLNRKIDGRDNIISKLEIELTEEAKKS